MAAKHGRCAVCGRHDRLTFEHVPPRKALNDRRIEICSAQDWLYRGSGDVPRGRVQQRGSGFTATCAKCNNDTGSWYGGEFGRWVFRGVDVLTRYAGPAPMDDDPEQHFVTAVFPNVRPALFLKQVVYMLLVVNGPAFSDRNPELRRFALDRERVGLPSEYHFHLALLWGPYSRHVGLGGKIDTDMGGSAVLSEIAFAPFSYTLRIGERLSSLPPCDVSGFAEYSPSDVRDVELHLLVGFCHMPLPCDFRSRSAVAADGGDIPGAWLYHDPGL
jgi:hypothetical protein